MLNTEHFVLLAGNSDKWDEETQRRVKAGESLPNVQINQHGRGRCSIQLVETIYGWSIRYASGLNGFGILWGSRMAGRKVTRDEAIEWGKRWVAEDPGHREFFAYKTDMEKEDKP
jgi:hypothetical protein